MSKKKALVIAVIMAAFVIVSVLTVLFLNGAEEKIDVTDVASFESTDNEYTLYFQQVGDPVWPFGKTNVRFVLKDKNGQTLNTTDTEIQDDGANAGKGNVKSVKWTDHSVIIILQASEMSDKEIILPFNR